MRKMFLRNLHGPLLLEMYLIFSVSTVLVIRLFLHYTGYPKLSISSSNLHIAHMLYGGALMFISQVISLVYLNSNSVRQLCSVFGGIGFGFFIDELGKFLTIDNDYFFKPTITILYILFTICFLLLYCVIEPNFSNIVELNTDEKVSNIFQILLNRDTTNDSDILLMEELLMSYEEDNLDFKSPAEEKLIQALIEYINSSRSDSRKRRKNKYMQIRENFAENYKYIVSHKAAQWGIDLFFFIQCAVQFRDILKNLNLAQIIMNLRDPFKSITLKYQDHVSNFSFPVSNQTDYVISVADIFEMFILCLSFFCVLSGIVLLTRCDARENRSQSRKKAFLWFRRSLLIKLLITNSLLIYYGSATRAVFEILITLVIISALSFAIREEDSSLRKRRLTEHHFIDSNGHIELT